jgi:hypothetical protein
MWWLVILMRLSGNERKSDNLFYNGSFCLSYTMPMYSIYYCLLTYLFCTDSYWPVEGYVYLLLFLSMKAVILTAISWLYSIYFSCLFYSLSMYRLAVNVMLTYDGNIRDTVTDDLMPLLYILYVIPLFHLEYSDFISFLCITDL